MLGHVLVVDDDLRIRQLLRAFLKENGYAVSTASSVAACEKLLAEFVFDIIVMDIVMPGETGVEYLRRKGAGIPVILLSALGQVDDRINGLESGADDYLTKPFDPRELLVRINKAVQRVSHKGKECKFGKFTLDMISGNLQYGDSSIHLTTAEKTILLELARSAGNIVGRESLGQVLGDVGSRTVDTHIVRLRSKIEVNPKSPEFLQTIRGEGYVLWAKL